MVDFLLICFTRLVGILCVFIWPTASNALRRLFVFFAYYLMLKAAAFEHWGEFIYTSLLSFSFFSLPLTHFLIHWMKTPHSDYNLVSSNDLEQEAPVVSKWGQLG